MWKRECLFHNDGNLVVEDTEIVDGVAVRSFRIAAENMEPDELAADRELIERAWMDYQIQAGLLV